MRTAAIAAAVVAAFVGVMYLRFSGDSVPGQPPGAAVGGSQCVVFRNVSDAEDPVPARTCGAGALAGVPPAIQPPAPTFTPTSLPRPDFLHDTVVHRLGMGPEVELPPGFTLIVETGCTQCDGPTEGIVRVYRDGSGAVRTETLASAEKLQLTPRIVHTSKGTEEYPSDITAFAVNPDGSELTAAFCTRGLCVGGGGTADSETTLFRSTDGGISWSELGRLAPGEFMIRGFLTTGSVIVSAYIDGTQRFYTFPNREELALPPPLSPYWQLKPLSGDQVLWQTDKSQLLRSDGTVFFDPTGQTVIGELLSDPLATMSVFATVSSPSRTYIAELGSDGRVITAYSSPHFLLLGAWPQEGLLFGNTSVYEGELGGPLPSPFFAGYLPALIDLQTGTIHPIREPFIDPPLANGRDTVLAVQRGPFARVVNTDNTCVNVRAEPLPSAGILDCAAEGVLLTDLLQFQEGGGVPWRRVRTPAGQEGWASMEFLETDPSYGHD